MSPAPVLRKVGEWMWRAGRSMLTPIYSRLLLSRISYGNLTGGHMADLRVVVQRRTASPSTEVTRDWWRPNPAK